MRRFREFSFKCNFVTILGEKLGPFPRMGCVQKRGVRNVIVRVLKAVGVGFVCFSSSWRSFAWKFSL